MVIVIMFRLIKEDYTSVSCGFSEVTEVTNVIFTGPNIHQFA